MWQEFQLPTEAQFLHLQAFGMTSTKDDFPRSTEGMRRQNCFIRLQHL